MRLGLNLGYWGAGNDANNLELAKEADRLGYSVAWAAEAYGSDVPTVLAWVAAHTERIDVGSAILQIPARRPTMAAMTAATLDTLSGGRFRLGLGVSGPQVSEGWYGVKFDKPLARTREYVDIVKQALRRERVAYQGSHFTLPLPDGPGKPLKLIVHPVREEIPIYLASIGPKNLRADRRDRRRLAGHLLLPGVRPGVARADRAGPAEGRPDHGRLRRGAHRADRRRRRLAGGGRPGPALRGAVRRRHGQPRAELLQQPRLPDGLRGGGRRGSRTCTSAKDYAGAAAAVPLGFLDSTSLLGPRERIADRMQALAESGVTTLTLSPVLQDLDQSITALRVAVEALDKAGVGD